MIETEMFSHIKQVFAYLRSDVDSYRAAERIGAGPYLLTAFSGIDFFGSLAVPESELKDREKEGQGLLRKSRAGSLWYIREWMGLIRRQYAEPTLVKRLYTDVRCGQVHEGIVKPGLLIGLNHVDFHLRPVFLDGGSRCTPLTSIGVLFVDTAVFADDFLDSAQFFLNAIRSEDCLRQRIFTRLGEHLEQAVADISGLGDPVRVGPEEFGELYETSSASPNDPGGCWLRNNLTMEDSGTGGKPNAEPIGSEDD